MNAQKSLAARCSFVSPPGGFPPRRAWELVQGELEDRKGSDVGVKYTPVIDKFAKGKFAKLDEHSLLEIGDYLFAKWWGFTEQAVLERVNRDAPNMTAVVGTVKNLSLQGIAEAYFDRRREILDFARAHYFDINVKGQRHGPIKERGSMSAVAYRFEQWFINTTMSMQSKHTGMFPDELLGVTMHKTSVSTFPGFSEMCTTYNYNPDHFYLNLHVLTRTPPVLWRIRKEGDNPVLVSSDGKKTHPLKIYQ
jgi:hypothetical protein